MARDIRTNANNFNDRNKYYKRIEGTQDFEEKPSGIFYSKDTVAMTITPVVINGKAKGVKKQVTIVTMDCVTDLQVDDIVEYGGERFRVDSITPNDVNENKRFTTRPRFETTIVLIK